MSACNGLKSEEKLTGGKVYETTFVTEELENSHGSQALPTCPAKARSRENEGWIGESDRREIDTV
jgi:hypothetical protein